MIMDDDDGQLIFGDLGGLKLPHICLTGEEKPRKNLTQETCPDRDRSRAPGSLGGRQRRYPSTIAMVTSTTAAAATTTFASFSPVTIYFYRCYS